MMEKIAIMGSGGVGKHVAHAIVGQTSIRRKEILIIDGGSFPVTNPFHDIPVINTHSFPKSGQDKRRERRKSQRKRFR